MGSKRMVIGITGNTDKQPVKEFIPQVLRWLEERNVEVIVHKETSEHLENINPDDVCAGQCDFCKRCAIVLSFGGDGTILTTARTIGDSGVPILGVKIGGMGFLAELSPEELFSSLEDILRGHYDVVKRMVLQAEIEGENTKLFALNDFVFDKGAITRVVRLKTFIDDEFLNTYISDGLIISTPTGSTAYSLAAGGPIILPSMEAIIINPISPHSLGARPVVIPGDKEVRLKIEFAPENVQLSADGQVRKKLQVGQEVTLRKADYHINLVSYRHRSFYDVLRAKLNWGGDIRDC